MFCSSSTANTYKPPDTDYICSRSNFSGMHTCHSLPPYVNGTIECQLTWEEKHRPEYINDDRYCINWHLYYSTCSDKNENPFQNTISFDNIGLAWIAIFLVSIYKLYFHAIPIFIKLRTFIFQFNRSITLFTKPIFYFMCRSYP